MAIAFYITAFMMILAALAVVVLRNPMYSALCLIANMIGVGILFALLDAHFLAIAQLIVYAGAVMVLVLFVLMLLNVKEEPYQWRNLPLLVGSLFVGGFFAILMIPRLAQLLKAGKATALEGTVRALGELLYAKYILTFEIASLLIMVALVGAVMLGSRKIHKKDV